MLDPIIDWIKAKILALVAIAKSVSSFLVGLVLGFGGAVRAFWRFVACSLTFRSPDPAQPLGVVAKLRRFAGALLALVFLGWYGHYFASAAVIHGFDYDYPNKIVHDTQFSPGHETTQPESGTAGAKSCGRSQMVDMEIALIHLVIEDNRWVPSMIQHKLGIFGYPWDKTPFWDRKSMFEKGVMRGIRRAAIEMVDTLGRVRGTSSADPDLETVRGLLNYDMETWWINPFDATRPGFATPSDDVYRKAIPLLERYNARLEKCEALFDARRDNLSQFLDRVSKDLGSTTDLLAKRSRSERWDVSKHDFVPSEGNDLGWFDLKADGMFWGALGESYAYHGLLRAAREDFVEAVAAQRLGELWDQTESHMAEAILLWPLIVSNGREDGLLMPAHLAAQAQRILRARANIVEMRDVLSR